MTELIRERPGISGAALAQVSEHIRDILAKSYVTTVASASAQLRPCSTRPGIARAADTGTQTGSSPLTAGQRITHGRGKTPHFSNSRRYLPSKGQAPNSTGPSRGPTSGEHNHRNSARRTRTYRYRLSPQGARTDRTPRGRKLRSSIPCQPA